MKFERVDSIPARKYNYEMKEQTAEAIAILKGMKDGETIVFPVNTNQTKKEMYDESGRLGERLKTAARHAPGIYKIYRRNFNQYVKRYSDSNDMEPPTEEEKKYTRWSIQ